MMGPCMWSTEPLKFWTYGTHDSITSNVIWSSATNFGTPSPEFLALLRPCFWLLWIALIIQKLLSLSSRSIKCCFKLFLKQTDCPAYLCTFDFKDALNKSLTIGPQQPQSYRVCYETNKNLIAVSNKNTENVILLIRWLDTGWKEWNFIYFFSPESAINYLQNF